MENVQKNFHSELSMSVYHEGGPINLFPNNIEDGSANRVAPSMVDVVSRRSRQERCSLHDDACPIAIANGPIPQMLRRSSTHRTSWVICAKQRSQILDGLNLMEFTAQNPGRFDYPAQTTPADIVAAANGYQSDLTVVSDTAAFAINHVADAISPPEFASKSGRIIRLESLRQLCPR